VPPFEGVFTVTAPGGGVPELLFVLSDCVLLLLDEDDSETAFPSNINCASKQPEVAIRTVLSVDKENQDLKGARLNNKRTPLSVNSIFIVSRNAVIGVLFF
jgi:hypothetical protein